MRAYLPSFDMRRARSLEEALALLAEPASPWRPFAGGTDVMVLLAAGTLRHQQLVSLWGIPELRRVDATADSLAIGALTTFSDLRRHAVVRSEFPLLAAAAAEIGGIANQNRATVGGNIANASPAADSPPALLAYDAELELVSTRGTRRVPYAAFHIGYKQMDLAAGELIARVHLPRRGGRWLDLYRKVGARRAQAISKVCFAGRLREGERGTVADVRLVFGSVAPTVVRASAAESVLAGARLDPATVDRAVEALTSDLAAIDDIRSTARYRTRVARNLLREFLAQAPFAVQGKMP